jgi:hypothetical protein
MCQFISVVNIADVAEDKNRILTRKRCCHLSDPVLSVRPCSKCPNNRRVKKKVPFTFTCIVNNIEWNGIIKIDN